MCATNDGKIHFNEGVHEGVHDHVENSTKSTYVGLVTKSTVTVYTVSFRQELVPLPLGVSI
jgi:hypothetical protein